jgi:hypothetical protein
MWFVALMAENRNIGLKIFVMNPAANKSLRGHCHKWKNNIKICCDM